jgi:hypothetical protein
MGLHDSQSTQFGLCDIYALVSGLDSPLEQAAKGILRFDLAALPAAACRFGRD